MSFERYSRHTLLPEWDLTAQEKVRQATILVVGAGGLGCPALQYLVAAGVGTIHLFDDDSVSESNLARQILYTAKDIGKPKVICAAQYLQQLNPESTVIPHFEKVTPKILSDFLPQISLVMDGCDNFQTRYWVNDACAIMGKPLVYGAVYQYEGQIAVFSRILPNGQQTGNLRDIFPDQPTGKIATCAEAGVLNALTGVIGTMMAAEALKIITNIGDLMENTLKIINLISGTTQNIYFKPSNVPINFPKELDSPTNNCSVLDKNTVTNILPNQILYWKKNNISFQLVDVRSLDERNQFSLGGIHCPTERVKTVITALNPKIPTVFYCHSGQRSYFVAETFAEKGYLQTYNLSGGILRFKSEYPAENSLDLT